MRELFLIAARNLVRNRRRSLLAMTAVFLGVAVLVAVRGFLNGLEAAQRENVIYGVIGALQVNRAGYQKDVMASPIDLDLPAGEEFLSRIRAVRHVTAAAPRIQFGAMINAGETTVFSLVTAVDPVHELLVCPRRERHVEEGAPVRPAPADGAVLARVMVQELGLSVGGRAAILASDRDGVLNGVDARLAGILGPSASLTLDGRVAVVSLGLAQELLRMPGRATEIAVAVDDLDHVPEARAAIAQAVGPGYEVSTWQELFPFLVDSAEESEFLGGFVTVIFLVVALLGIAETMLMNVLERTREIGTMMAVGVRRSKIVRLFLLEAALLGLVGSVPGAAAGFGLIEYLSTAHLWVPNVTGEPMEIIPAVSAGYALRMVAIACLGAALAAIYPAWKASRMRPVEALTHA